VRPAEHLVRSRLRLLGRDLFLARGDGPVDSERILHGPVAVAPELVADRHGHFAPGGDRLAPRGVGVRNVQVHDEGHPANGERRLSEFGTKIVGQHHQAVAYLDRGVHQLPARTGRTAKFHGIECTFQEIDVIGRAFHHQVQGERMKTGRYGSRFWHSDSIPARTVTRYACPMRFLPIFVAILTIEAQNIGIDSHIDTAQRILIDQASIAQRSPVGHVDIPRLKEGGVNAPFFALWVPTYYKGPEAIRRTLDLRDAMQRLFDTHPELIAPALTAADVERITRSGRIAAILALEGGHQIDDDLAVLRMYYRLGIRAMTLTHFRNTNWADSSTDTPAHNGLTEFGKQVVREMNRMGMIVDVSHVSDKTFFDVLAVTSKPVIASHSSCRALSDVPRNMTDEMLAALAKNGGVVGINFGEGFLNPQDAEILKNTVNSVAFNEPSLTGKALDQYAADEFHKDLAPKAVNATIDDAVDHIDHAVKIAGVDHVGIGSDFDGISGPPKGLEDISKMPALKAALRKKGYSEEDIRKIFGANTLRVLREVTGK